MIDALALLVSCNTLLQPPARWCLARRPPPPRVRVSRAARRAAARAAAKALQSILPPSSQPRPHHRGSGASRRAAAHFCQLNVGVKRGLSRRRVFRAARRAAACAAAKTLHPSITSSPSRAWRCPASCRLQLMKRNCRPQELRHGPCATFQAAARRCPPLPPEFREGALCRIVVAKAQLCRPPPATAARCGLLWLRRPQ